MRRRPRVQIGVIGLVRGGIALAAVALSVGLGFSGWARPAMAGSATWSIQDLGSLPTVALPSASQAFAIGPGLWLGGRLVSRLIRGSRRQLCSRLAPRPRLGRCRVIS